ncbi:hypothetical protein [Helicobacter bizzozeronii]|uniref:hypothetical protein n=1 Tax=Helicobacter bizzozeronii TaxID=56877 RepID=UPI000680B346|nr:hypothetical protein [Helicobacter bizzozeronii]
MQKPKSWWSKRWTLRARGRYFALMSVMFPAIGISRGSISLPENSLWMWLVVWCGGFLGEACFGRRGKYFKTRFDDSIVLAIAILFGAVPVHWAFATFWWMPNVIVLAFCQIIPMILIILVINKVISGRWQGYPEHSL